MKSLPIICLLSLLMSLNFISAAAIDVHRFDTESQRQRYHTLVDELRCPKCQNQNLAGSNSQIAQDLRRELHRLLLEGKTDREIKTFMVDRYGDFVLYQPPLKATTLLLWVLPLLLIVIGIGLLIAIQRKNRQLRRQQVPNQALSESDKSKLEGLLNDSNSHSSSNPNSHSSANPSPNPKPQS